MVIQGSVDYHLAIAQKCWESLYLAKFVFSLVNTRKNTVADVTNAWSFA